MRETSRDTDKKPCVNNYLTWANQIRLLQLNIQQLAATIGQGLIAAVIPAVTALNKLFTVLQKAAIAVRNFFYVLTGYEGGGSSGIVTDISTAMDDIADSSGAATGGISDAADAAEELKDQLTLLPFDQIQKLSDASVGDTGTGGGGGSGTGLGDTIGGIDDALSDLGGKKPEKYVNAWAERIRKAFLAEDWELLGEEIAWGLNKGLQKVYDVISWDNVGPKITAFTTAFTETFNSFANSFDFELLGRTIGTGINTIVNTLNQLIDGIDWINLGRKFSDGFNGLVDEVDWFELGRLIGNKFMIAWDTLLGIVTTLDWGEVGRSLADGFNGMLQEISLGDIGTTIGTIVAGIIEMFREFFANADWGEVINQIKEGISNALKAASDGGKNDGILAGMLGITAISGISKTFLEAVPILNDLKNFFGGKDKKNQGMFRDLGAGVKEKVESLVGVFKGGSSKISGYLDDIALNSSIAFEATGSASSGLLTRVASALGNFFGKLGGLSTGATFGLIAGGLTIIIGGIIDLWNTSESFRSSVSEMWDEIAGAFSEAKVRIWDETLVPLAEEFSEFWDSIYSAYESSGLKDIFEQFVTFLGDQLASKISGFINVVSNAFQTVGGIASGILEVLTGVINFVTGVFTGNWDKAWSGVKNIVKGVVDAISSFFSGLWETITIIFSPVVNFFKNNFTKAKDAVLNAWKNISNWFQERWTAIKNVFAPVASTFQGWFQNAYTNVQNIWTNVSGWFSGKWQSVKNVFSDVKEFFRSGFQNAYDAITKIFDKLGGYFGSVLRSVTSPIKGIVNGIIGGVNWVLDKVGAKKIKEWPGFAKGSNGIPEDTFGVVNDQKGATYKELIVPPHGKPFIPKGRNVMLPLEKGTKIMPAGQTKELMKSMKIPRFAGGIGDFVSGAWNAIKNFTGNVWDYITNPGEILKVALNKFVSFKGLFEPWLGLAGGIVNKTFDGIKEYIKGIFDKLVPKVNYNPSAGVEQWRSLAKYALQLTGQYTEANLNRLLMQMQTESGGNPNAINNWDINAKNGTPSKGLMQVIDPTFQAYKYPGYNNIWDPLSNMLAAIRYTLSRYGSLANGWRGHGYAEGIGTITISDIFKNIPKLAGGGMVMPGQLFVANERGPELVGRYGNRTAVMNNDQITASVSDGVAEGVYRAMMSAMQSNRNSGSGDMHITIDIGGERFVTKIVSQYNKMKKGDPNFGFVV